MGADTQRAGANDGAGQQSTQHGTQEPQQNEQQLSNADVKSHPVFQKVASELAEYRQREADKKAADEKAKIDAERQKLEAEGKYEDAIKMRDKQIEELQASHKKELLQRDLKAELYKSFDNEIFVNGAIGGYQGDSDGVADYVNGLLENEQNKVFMRSQQGQPRETLPEPQGSGSGGSQMSVDDAKRLSKETNDPKVKQQAWKVLEDYYDKHGRMP